MDDQLAKLFRSLKALELFDQCVVAITADHGECLGEHKIYYERGVPWDPLVRIPLILRVPGVQGAGRAIQGQVRQVDLLPTLLGLAGLSEVAAPLIRDHFDGESFAGSLGGRLFTDRIAFGEQGMTQIALVRLPPWKYIEMKPIRNWAAMEDFNREFFRGRNEVREFFNIHDDPKETRNLIEAAQRKAHEMRVELFKHKAVMARKRMAPGKASIDEAARRRLRALGYVQ